MAAEGRLPNLASLAERGRTLELETPAVDFAAGSFYSLYSGVELGDHGIFYPFQWSAPEQRAVYASALEAPPAVWERLAAAGRRTLAIDPYESRPPAVADGVFVCGWGLSDRVVLPRWSRPAPALRAFERRYGRAPDATETFGRPGPGRAPRAAGEARRRARARRVARPPAARRAALRPLLADVRGRAPRRAPVLGPEPARPRTASAPATARSSSGRSPTSTPRSTRRSARSLEALPEGTDVIVTSPVGMERDSSSRRPASRRCSSGCSPAAPRSEDGDAEGGAIWRLRAAVPAGLRRRVAAALPRRLALELTARLELRGIEWASTAAFAHPADNQGYVRLNLAGRERDGIVAPGRGRGRCSSGSPPGWRSSATPDGTPGRRRGRPAPATSTRERGRTGFRTSSSAGLRAPAARSSRSATGRCAGAAPAPAARATTPRAAPGRCSRPGDGELVDPVRPPRLVDVAASVCAATGVGLDGLAGEPLLARRAPQALAGRSESAARAARRRRSAATSA